MGTGKDKEPGPFASFGRTAPTIALILGISTPERGNSPKADGFVKELIRGGHTSCAVIISSQGFLEC